MTDSRKFALVYVGAGIGNVIFATPAMQVLDDLDYTVDVLVNPDEAHYLGILSGLPFIRHTYSGPPRQYYDVFLSTALRITYNPDWASCLRLGGVALQAHPPEYPDTHEAEMNCAPLTELGWDGKLPLPRITAEPVLRGKHVVLLPDCKPEQEWAIKKWAPDKWIELSRRIRSAAYVPVVMSAEAKSIEWTREGKALNLGGMTSISQAAGFIAGAKAAVGIDNGLVHVAAATGVPHVVLWGSTSWTKNRPLGATWRVKVGPTADCAPCQFGQSGRAKGQWPRRVKCDRPAPPCMQQSVDAVFAALEECLRGRV